MEQTATTIAASTTPTVTLEFDRGTIVVDGLTTDLAGQLSELVSWDQRTNVWRAPAHSYAVLAKHLNALFPALRDAVRDPGRQILESDWRPVALRSYQEAALLAWRAAGGRGIVCLPTGAGKTRVAVAAMQRTKRPTLCLVPTRVLMHQWVSAIREFYSGPVGSFGDGTHDIQPITVSTFESAYRAGWWLGNKFDLLVVDEVHHFGDGKRDEALESFTSPFRLGLSATLDNERLGLLKELIGLGVFDQKLEDLVGGALAEFDVACLHLPLTTEERRAYDADYEVFRQFFRAFQDQCPGGSWDIFLRLARQSGPGRAAVNAYHRAKRQMAFTLRKREMLLYLLARHSEQRKLIFTADSATALHVARQYLVAPITADIGRAERAKILEAFRQGTLRTIVSCNVLNEGLDVPAADVAIIVGGTGANREHIQRIGRVLRPAPGKRAQIYELLAADTMEVGQSRRRGRDLAERRHEGYIGATGVDSTIPGPARRSLAEGTGKRV